ncbi:MAG TPA: S8 family serine peptidase [Verrucomicrobiae bacterium]
MLAFAGKALSQKAALVAAAKTNQMTYRLSNTGKTLEQLMHDRHAILLENALIDVSKPVNLAFPKQLQAKGDPGAYIVQSRGMSSATFRAMLTGSGARIISYIPNNAYLVEASSSIASAVATSPAVQSVLPYEPYYKIQYTLLGAAVNQTALPPDAKLTLGLFSDTAAQTITQIQSMGAQIVGQDSSPFGPVVRVTAPANWTALADLPGIAVVEPYYKRETMNDLSRVITGVATNTLVPTNYMDLTGQNVTVEVNDTGIDAQHPDFSVTGSAESPGSVPPSRITGVSTDTDGHGTFVAGEIAGNGSESYPPGGNNVGLTLFTNNFGSVSNADFRGKAPAALLVSVIYNNSSDSNLQASAALTNALISNNSWDYGGDQTYDLAAASYDAATRDALPYTTGSQPVLFVFAAGNDGFGGINADGNTADTIDSPGTAKDVITVGALEQPRNITNIVVYADGTSNEPWIGITENNYEVADFSSCGNVGIGIEGQYGRFKPDVVAPGAFVVSTRSTEWEDSGYYNPTNYTDELFTNLTLDTDSLDYFTLNVPPNAISVEIDANSIGSSANLEIGVNPNFVTGTYDFVKTNQVLIPSDGGSTYLSQIQGTFLNYAIINSNASPVSYDLFTQVATTNDLGNYYLVLSNLNQSIGPWYRFESGTSMAAADVSGVLALMEDYFTNHIGIAPSPALLKAMLLNGARLSDAELYNLQVNNAINYEGWGLVNLPNSLPPTIATNGYNGSTASSIFFVDQSPTNALPTGASQTYQIAMQTNTSSLHVTLAWTDPPGNPVAAIKLVNSLELIVSNLDNVGATNQVVYYGNDIPQAGASNTAESPTNNVPVDTINNVQTVIVKAVGTNYLITVKGYEVNVNAVVEQTNNVVQDYALVVSAGDGTAPGSFTVTNLGMVYNATSDQDVAFVAATNTPLYNQTVGSSTPLLGTNQITVGTNSLWATNGLITLGMTNQWHFYIVTNEAEDASGSTSDVTNAAFVTFNANTLALPRTGVFANNDANSTRTEADLNIFATTVSSITNLDPVALSNCVAGGQVGATAANTFNGAALGRGGEEVIVDTNSHNGEIYYIGVQSEDREGAEYNFIPIFTSIPFSTMNNSNGIETVNCTPIPSTIPSGSPQLPGYNDVVGISLQSMQIQTVIVTNIFSQANVGDLVSSLTLDSGINGYTTAVLMNHTAPNTNGTFYYVYDDSGAVTTVPNPYTLHHSDGPGSLLGFAGKTVGIATLWNYHIANSVSPFSGSVDSLQLMIIPHQNPQKGIVVSIPPGAWYYNFVQVGPGFTNLTVAATNLPPTIGPPPLELYLNHNTEPTASNFLFEADLTNYPPGLGLTYPTGLNPGNAISYGPPLAPGTYWIGITNPSATTTASVYLIATLGGLQGVIPPSNTASNGPSLTPEAVTSTNIFINNSNATIASVNVGIVATYPRISDLTFTLVSPSGQEVLLMENRGGITTSNAGVETLFSNVVNSTATGGAAAQTNYLTANPAGGVLPISYNFYSVPDEMTVYDTTNPANLNSTTLLLDTGFISNPPTGPGAQQTQIETTNVTYPPNSPGLTIIMNQFGNPFASGNGDAWTYTAGSSQTNFEYLMFTEDTNLTDTPIMFAVPPFGFDGGATNYSFSFEQATNVDYHGQTNIFDPLGGWTVPTNITTVSTFFNLVTSNTETITNTVILSNNFVTVETDPANSLGDNFDSNYLALADGTITRSIPTVQGDQYNITFWYRGPGIAGWWRGEGNALDSANPENDGQNGSLIGRFDFPLGEVGQAFEMEYNGQPFDFAGTNSYVQIHPQYSYTANTNGAFTETSALDVGADGGLTVEGWINPTNTLAQQPLVEWLAGVPTNYPNITDTNFNIVAGPFLDRATSHYYYLLGATNWTVSENWAQMLGGHLAEVNSADEENWIYDAFEYFVGTNRNFWIGLTNSGTGTPFVFAYSTGLTNITYTDWGTNQPDNNCFANQNYVGIFTATNALSGLWEMANDAGSTCVSTNLIYGVVEVPLLQTNGVQFWISVTNIPGTTNTIVSSNGCLYANLMDISNNSHIIFSAPGLVQSNIFQHVALTYNTNSGIANLFYDGTNVASTNFGYFIPKTTGDVLLGKDMSLLTNNYYGGLMDEMSIYTRPLSDAEIWTIYNVSASLTNGQAGKFDPSVTPASGLAEAGITLGGYTNVLYGVNDRWSQFTYTFIAVSNSLPISITGLEPGMLLNQFNVTQSPVTNFYYLPEQSLDELVGDDPYGNWSLQIWDNRTDSLVTQPGVLNSWILQMVLQTNAPSTVDLNPNTPTTITVPPGQIVPLYIVVPDWASEATNVLDSATGPIGLLFNSTLVPTGNNTTPPDYTFLANSTAGSRLLTDTGTPPGSGILPLLPTSPTNYYYLGLSNAGPHAVNATVEVDFNIVGLTNDVPYTGTVNTNQSENYFYFNVTNGYEATFQLLKLSGEADLVVRKGPPLPTLLGSDYGSFNESNAAQNIYVLTNSTPVPLTNGTWYIGVMKRDSGALRYTVLAKELGTNSAPFMTVIPLTNNVPYTFTNEDLGAALTNFFIFDPTNNPALTNAMGVRFEVYDMTGNGDLTVQTNLEPFAPPFYQSSQQPGTIPESILIQTNSVLTNLNASWYLGVPNNETNPINFTIIAEIETNGVFPAFPGAQGAGAGTTGGGGLQNTNIQVYHVTSLNDDGSYGTLRDAVTRTNRTIVFDISGVIFLQTPLVITNSFLTIAGQTAPGAGITVAGQMTELSTNHDVIIRDVRFRAGGEPLTGFEYATAGDYTNSQLVGTWRVLSNEVSVITDTPNAKEGSNFVALANGTIYTNLSTIPGQAYSVTFSYRGPDLVHWWRAETNSTSTTAIDSIGTNNGTLHSVIYTNGMVGRAFYLNGASYISVPYVPSLEYTNSFTLEMWFKNFGASNYGLMGNRNDPGACNYGINIVTGGGDVGVGITYYDPTDPGYPANNSDDPNYLDVSRDQMVPTIGVYHHLAASLQQIASDSIQIKTYYDGQLVKTKVMPGNFVNTLNTLPLTIGATDPGGEFLNGMLDEVSLYNRCLSLSEANAIYQNGTNGKFDSVEYNLSPATSVAKAQILVNGKSVKTFFGNDTNWQSQTFTFTAVTNKTLLAISGLEPGILLDGLNVIPGDSLQFIAVSNVIADHISAEWSTNNNISVLGSTNMTVQWSIIADSVHSVSTNGYGSLLRGGYGTLSFHHNLYADNAYGNPRLGDNINLDFENNVIYDWGTNSGFTGNDTLSNPNGFTNVMNYIGNYLIASTNSLTNTIAFWPGATNTWIYQTNNFIQSTNNATNALTRLALAGENIGWNMFTTNGTRFDREFPFPPITVDEAYMAYEKVMDFAGPDMALRDAVDTNIVGNVRTQTGAILNATQILPTPNSLFPYLDTDQDGIPDFWDDTFGGSPFVPHPYAVVDGSGYTELEEYLDWLAAPHALTVTTNQVGVDLQQMFGEVGNLSFFLTNAVNGTVYLTNVLNYTNVAGAISAITNSSTYSNTFAIFTPTNDFGGGTNYGAALFDVYVTNNTTLGYFGPVTVSVVASKVPIVINSNIPPVITILTNGVLDPTNNSGSDYYGFSVGPNASGVLFTVTNISVPNALDMVVAYNRTPSLSDYDYISTNTANESVVVWTNSRPVPLTSGNWYVAVVNVNPTNGPVSYDISATAYGVSPGPPIFTYPTNTTVFTNIETTLFTVTCQAVDTNIPAAPLTFALDNQPANVAGATNIMTINPNTGVINWTPNEAQGPSTNAISVSVNNGAFSVTNTFKIIVEESNQPPVFVYTNFPAQLVIVPGGMLDVTDAAVNPNIPNYPLTYSLLNTPAGAVIDANGVITWSPTLSDAGSNYLFTVVATDTDPPAINATSLSTTNEFYVTVTSQGGGSPQTNTVPPGGISWIAVTVPTGAISATNDLIIATPAVNVWFSTNLPPSTNGTGDQIIIPGSTGGISVLTTNSFPTNIVPGRTYFLGVQNPNAVPASYDLVVNFGYPVITNSIRISSIVHTNIAGTNGYLLTWFAPSNFLFQVQWTADLLPADWATFTNIVGYNTNKFTSPAHTQFNFFDDGSQTSNSFGAMRFYQLLLLQASTLTLPPQTNIVVQAGSPVTVTNTATDSNPSATLTYNLVNPPAGASIDTNGVITWTNATPSGLAALFTTVVSDNEVPQAQTSNQFTVFVAPFPTITNVAVTSSNVTLSWLAPSNDQFEVQYTTNLASPITWDLLSGIITTNSNVFSYTDTNALLTMKFYELILLP